MRYYAVRYKSAPDQIRIEKAETPVRAFTLAFGTYATPMKGLGPHAEYKDLGTRISILKSDKKRIAILTDPKDWVDFTR
jgi:hypothetical protein